MIKNYILVSVRSLAKNKVHTAINLIGLAVGIACCMLIWLYVSHQLSYDTKITDGDRIYRLATDAFPPGSPVDAFATSAPVAAQTLRDEVSEFELIGRMQNWGPAVRHNDTYYYDDRKHFTDTEFLKIFDIQFIEGDRETALESPRSVVITQDMAQKYFGGGSALGQTITFQDTLAMKVTGVIPNTPRNSHLDYDILVSMPTLEAFGPFSIHWLSCSMYVYGKTVLNTDIPSLQAKLKALPMEKFGENLSQIGFTAELLMQPVSDIHLTSSRLAEIKPNGSSATVTIFTVVALFVLLIGCINFINLSTARSVERAREVGLRKVLGGARSGLVQQFLTESVLVTVLACLLSFALLSASLSWFNDLSGEQFVVADLLRIEMLIGVVIVILVTGLLAGSYPAFVLSGFPILDVLKGQFKMGGKGIWLRHGLVMIQFAISVALIASTLIVSNQLEFMRNADLGFDKEQLFVVNGQTMPPGTMQQKHETLKEEIAKIQGVTHVAASGSVPGRGTGLLIVSPEGLPPGDSRRMHILNADYNFVDTYGIDILAGRNFSREFGSDPLSAILINETALRSLDWGEPADAIGKSITIGNYNGIVVGVINDFHYYSLKSALEPMIVLLNPNGFGMLSVRVQTDSMAETIADIEKTVVDMIPGYSFNAFFLDDDFDNQYQTEDRLGRVFAVFSFIAIVIACMGLFGMVVYITSRRTREIGIRKVLGARVSQIIFLLGRDFMIPVLLGLIVAIGPAWYLMNLWLVEFPYRIAPELSHFAIAGGIGLIIALITVIIQSYRAAQMDPATSIRYE